MLLIVLPIRHPLMRSSNNPIKLSPALKSYKLHRVIMPVYIPSESDYYKDAFNIFKISLGTLLNTTSRDLVNITIINNSCIEKVDSFVRQLYNQGQIDQYIINKSNRGKADSIISAAKGSYEPFLTISDADVFFEKDWLYQIQTIFEAFPKAGVVCPFPAPNLKFRATASTWLWGLFNIRIKYSNIVNSRELDFFAKSIGIENFFHKSDYAGQFYLSKNGVKALIGSGHFVATYRRSVFKTLKYKPELMGLRGGLIKIEEQVDNLGLLSLSSPRSKVKHMGNKKEAWMKVELISPSSVNTSMDNDIQFTLLRLVPSYVKKILLKSISVFFILRRKLALNT